MTMASHFYMNHCGRYMNNFENTCELSCCNYRIFQLIEN